MPSAWSAVQSWQARSATRRARTTERARANFRFRVFTRCLIWARVMVISPDIPGALSRVKLNAEYAEGARRMQSVCFAGSHFHPDTLPSRRGELLDNFLPPLLAEGVNAEISKIRSFPFISDDSGPSQGRGSTSGDLPWVREPVVFLRFVDIGHRGARLPSQVYQSITRLPCVVGAGLRIGWSGQPHFVGRRDSHPHQKRLVREDGISQNPIPLGGAIQDLGLTIRASSHGDVTSCNIL